MSPKTYISLPYMVVIFRKWGYLKGRSGDLELEDNLTTATKARRRVDTTRMVGGRLLIVMIIGIEGKDFKKESVVRLSVSLIRMLALRATLKQVLGVVMNELGWMAKKYANSTSNPPT